MKRFLSLGLTALFLILSTAFAQQDTTSTELPVTKLVVFTNGVAYVEHSATIDGDVEFILPVSNNDMNDVLQSLVMYDHDGGSINAVNYNSHDPLDRILGTYQIDVRSATSFAKLLNQAVGENVSVSTADNQLSGTILSTEQHEDDTATEFVTLVTDAGIRRVNLADITSLTFENQALQNELNAALRTIAQHRAQGEAGLTLRFTGEGQRDVTIGYVKEMPVWKTTYRLSLESNGEAHLQAWAILDNPSETDLTDVEVTLVSGNPISFITNLYEPRYVDRRLVDVHTSPAPVAESVADVQAYSMARNSLSSSGFSGEATAEAGRTTFSFNISEPVTVSRHQSVMIPLFSETLNAEPVWHVRESQLQHVFESIHVANTGDLTLPAGPITLYEDGVFNGTGTMPFSVAGTDTVVIPFGIATDVTVRRDGSDTVQTSERLVIADGVLEHTVRATSEQNFVIEAPFTQRAQQLYFDISPTNGWTPATGGEVLEDGTVRIAVSLDSGGQTVQYVEERLISQSTRVSNLQPDQLLVFINDPNISGTERTALSNIRDTQMQLATQERELNRIEREHGAIFNEQERIRENMDVLDRDSTLYEQYVDNLTTQEGQLTELGELATDVRTEIEQLQQRLSEAIQQLQ